MSVAEQVETVDLADGSLRELNTRLHAAASQQRAPRAWRILNPSGRHNVAVGLDAELDVEIDGHVGYYCAGMNQHATVRVHGNCGVGIAENMMSGRCSCDGNASQSAGASARGGMLVIHGDASARCAISLKGADIVVRGTIGHMGAFMAQRAAWSSAATPARRSATPSTRRGSTCAGSVASLGADCIEKEMREEHRAELRELLAQAGIDDVEVGRFRRYGSARTLYNFQVDDAGSYCMSAPLDPATGARPARVGDLRPHGDPRDPARRPHWHLRHPRRAGPSGACRISTTCCCLAQASRAIRWRATASAARPTSCSGPALRSARSS